MTQPKFASAKEAKEAGWFSRRHQSRSEHDAARLAYKNKKNQKNLPKGEL